MNTRAEALRLAEALGAEVEETDSGLHAWTPAGVSWALTDCHLIAVPADINGESIRWGDLYEAMSAGVQRGCDEPDCEVCA